MIPKTIMDCSFSVFMVSNTGQMATLTMRLSFRAVLWTDEQVLLASDRLSCCGIVFRESYLPVMFDLECESLKRVLLDSSCGQPEVNLKLPVTLSTMLYMPVTGYMFTVIFL